MQPSEAKNRPPSSSGGSVNIRGKVSTRPGAATLSSTYMRTNSRRSSAVAPTGGGGASSSATSSRVRVVAKKPPRTPVRPVLSVSSGTSPTAPATTPAKASGGGGIGLPPQHQVRSAPTAADGCGGAFPGSYHTRQNSSLRSSRESVAGLSGSMTKGRRRYVVGVMSHCGSIYEELTRQLLATGRWTVVTVKQRAGVKTLYVDETKQDINDVNVHLLLGDKPSCERIIAARRALSSRIHHGPAKAGSSFPPGPRVPMGNGDDGEPRVIDFVENTRCITLKSTMVSTLLRHHHYDWNELGSYLPMTFKISPNKPMDDDRRRLLEIARSHTDGTAPLWIAKSSSGCHGDNIEIFPGGREGLQCMLAYIDRSTQPWVAQQYIDRPLLYHKRKFDIRVMVLYIRDTGEIFVHEDLVMRMSSVVYNRESATGGSQEAKLAHITNHCIQETGKYYSAFEEGNELWKEHLDGLIRYKADRLSAARRRELLKTAASSTNASLLNTSRSANAGQSPYPMDLNAAGSDTSPANGSGGAASSSANKASGSGITLRNAIMPQINRIAVETVLAAQPFLPREPHPFPTHCFQVLGYDFLIDETLKVWLIEINGAPGGPTRLVPKIMGDTIDLAINPFFPCSIDSKPKVPSGYTRVYPE